MNTTDAIYYSTDEKFWIQPAKPLKGQFLDPRPLNDNEMYLFHLIWRGGALTHNQLKTITTFNQRTLQKRLQFLLKLGLIYQWEIHTRQAINSPKSVYTVGKGLNFGKRVFDEDPCMVMKYDDAIHAKIQRMMAVNDLLATLYQEKVLNDFRYYPVIGEIEEKPVRAFTTIDLDTKNGRITFYLDRLTELDSTNMVNRKVEMYRRFWNRKESGWEIENDSSDFFSPLLYVPTIEYAKTLINQYALQDDGIQLVFCMEDMMLQWGIKDAFYIVTPERLEKLQFI
ncbi:MAG: hypothetical protein ACI35O_13180 [Bacillaceae bacterium]